MQDLSHFKLFLGPSGQNILTAFKQVRDGIPLLQGYDHSVVHGHSGFQGPTLSWYKVLALLCSKLYDMRWSNIPMKPAEIKNLARQMAALYQDNFHMVLGIVLTTDKDTRLKEAILRLILYARSCVKGHVPAKMEMWPQSSVPEKRTAVEMVPDVPGGASKKAHH